MLLEFCEYNVNMSWLNCDIINSGSQQILDSSYLKIKFISEYKVCLFPCTLFSHHGKPQHVSEKNMSLSIHLYVLTLLGAIVDTMGKRVCWTVLCIHGKGRNFCYAFYGVSNGNSQD